MTLAYCLALDEDALICDFAETYHIFNYRELSSSLVATLLIGLSEASRIKMKLSGQRLTLEQALLARMVDDLAFIAWSKTKDGSKNRNRPESVLNKLLHPDDYKNKEELEGFTTAEDFHKAWDESVKRGNNND